MTKQDLRDNINSIKRKLTIMDTINEDTINEIIEDVKALLNFKLDTETKQRIKHIKKASPIKENKIVKPNTEEKPTNTINDIEFTVSQGGFMLDFGME